MNAPLPATVRLAAEVIAKLHEAGITEEDPDFAALLESEADLDARLCRIVRASRWYEKQAEALASIIEENKSRQARLATKVKAMRETVCWAMQEAGRTKLPAPDFTVGLAKGKPPLILDADLNPKDLPDALCTIRREPAKAKIREVLEAGGYAYGARLGNAQPYLTVTFR